MLSMGPRLRGDDVDLMSLVFFDGPFRDSLIREDDVGLIFRSLFLCYT